jgi:hypothetical protein
LAGAKTAQHASGGWWMSVQTRLTILLETGEAL